jgi:hypothetical protein
VERPQPRKGVVHGKRRINHAESRGATIARWPEAQDQHEGVHMEFSFVPEIVRCLDVIVCLYKWNVPHLHGTMGIFRSL